MSAAVGTYTPKVKVESGAAAAPAAAKAEEVSHLEIACGTYLPAAVIKQLLPVLGPHFHSSHILHAEVSNHEKTGVYISKIHHVVKKGPPIVKETTFVVTLRSVIPGKMNVLFRKHVNYDSSTSSRFEFKKPTDDSKAFSEALAKYIKFAALYNQLATALDRGTSAIKQEPAPEKVPGKKAPPAKVKVYEPSAAEHALYEQLRGLL
jgi:hypothetical protein